ncbi:MAG: glycosyltransferase family 4 protein, partial [Fibrobacter sp.]|nr:glycosyltransferase family 4 protein [Fibrobacter sp.]
PHSREFMEKQTLAIVTDSYWPAKGGIEQASLALAKNLKEHYTVFAVTHCIAKSTTLYGKYAARTRNPLADPYGTDIFSLKPSIIDRLILLPLLIWNIPPGRYFRSPKLFDFLFIFYRAAFKRKLEKLVDSCSIVHCLSTNYLARCITEICFQKGIPFVHSPSIHFGRWGDSPAQIKAYCCADAVVCYTESFKSKLLQFDNEKIAKAVVIPPIITRSQAGAISELPVQHRFILFLGRREAHKGLAMLLVAFAGIEAPVKLVIAGPGEPIKSRNDSIIDLGEIDEKMKNWLLSACEFLCVPSSDETFGIVFAEAMSYGKPVISLDVTPMNEIIQNGVSGFLVSPDNTNDLHNAIEKLLYDHKLRAYMGNASLERYKSQFETSIILDKYLSLYKSLNRL